MKLSRRAARILAMEALFAWDFTHVPLEQLLEFGWLDSEKGQMLTDTDLVFPRLLVSGTLENLSLIDECISKHLRGWELERIAYIDKAILRFSIYSLLFQKDIPPSVVIDEAVSIANEYGTDDSFKFINGVLDSIKNEITS